MINGKVSPAYLGTTGAFPLIKTYTAPAGTIFYRSLFSGKDRRFAGGQLKKDTYLTTELDKAYFNTGFSIVGRYALPIPLPAVHCIQYQLIANTQIKAGTVAPMFGQAGGGVEVVLTANTNVTKVGSFLLQDY